MRAECPKRTVFRPPHKALFNWCHGISLGGTVRIIPSLLCLLIARALPPAVGNHWISGIGGSVPHRSVGLASASSCSSMTNPDLWPLSQLPKLDPESLMLILLCSYALLLSSSSNRLFSSCSTSTSLLGYSSPSSSVLLLNFSHQRLSLSALSTCPIPARRGSW